MPDRQAHTRRRYLKAISAGGLATMASLGGCLQGSGTSTDAKGISGPIQMGSIMPLSGKLKAYGPGMQEAIKIAKKDLNDAGGPGGAEIKLHKMDSGTSTKQAKRKYNSLVNQNNIVGFVGAASSGVSTTLAQNVAKDEVMEVSNASTSPALTNMGYKKVDGEKLKFFGRTAPSDGQQGRVMGEFIMGKDKYIGAKSAAFLHVGNAYGKGLANKAAESFPGKSLRKVPYDPKSSDYSTVLSKLHRDDPDAIGFVGYPKNGRTILKQWSRQDYGTKASDWVLSEGLNSSKFLTDLKDIVSGMYLSTPDPKGKTKSLPRFKKKMPKKYQGTLFAPHAYDAMFLMGLALHKADEASGPAIARNIREVSKPKGEKVYAGGFKKAKKKLDDGKKVDYVGASSPVNLNNALQPLNPFAIFQVKGDGSLKKIDRVPRSTFMG